jgi:hypothetical protein
MMIPGASVIWTRDRFSANLRSDSFAWWELIAYGLWEGLR